MTIQQANQYFAALPDGFADPEQLGALLPASVQQVQFVGVAGTAGKTAVARLLTAILQAQGIRAGVYHAGCEPLAARIRVAGEPVDETLLCRAAACHRCVLLWRSRLHAGGGGVAGRGSGCGTAPNAGVCCHSGGAGRREPLGGASGCAGRRRDAQGQHLRHRAGTAQGGAQ